MTVKKAIVTSPPPEQLGIGERPDACRLCASTRDDRRTVECMFCHDRHEREAIREYGGG